MPQTATPQTLQWYVVHTKPFKERLAAITLKDQLGLNVYLPNVRRYHHGKFQSVPLFPRYLFVQANLQQIKISSIRAAPGVLRLVTFGDTLRPVPVAIIKELPQWVDALNAQGGLLPHNFQPGQVVRLKSGALRGLEAIFAGPMHPSERVRVLIDFLGRLNEVKVAVRELEHANTVPVPERVRYTRGKGRTIKRS